MDTSSTKIVRVLIAAFMHSVRRYNTVLSLVAVYVPVNSLQLDVVAAVNCIEAMMRSTALCAQIIQ